MSATTSTVHVTRKASLWQRLYAMAIMLTQPQVSSAARERRDILVLLVALVPVVLPHVDHLPWWTTAVLVLLWVWRLWLALMQRPLPGRVAILPLLVAVAASVWIEHRTILGRDAGVTFLVMLLALKLLEMRTRRDIFVIVFLSFFILLTQFLFNQSLVVALLSVAAVILLFGVLVSINMTNADLSARGKLAVVSLMLVKALPLAAALFILFPRISGPLWGMPGDKGVGRTGLSTMMTPGAIGRLLQSEEIAFRVRFNGVAPAPDQLYWRGPVLGTFGGRSWVPLASAAEPVPLKIEPQSTVPIEYTVTLEPHQRDWLFALEMPALLPTLDTMTARLTNDGQLLASNLVSQRLRYALRSHTGFRFGLNETPLSLQEWVQLPAGFNPRTLQLANELRATVPGALESRSADSKLVREVLERFRQENFHYSLTPPTLGRDSVDEFLFETKEGFCEHYASAFVVLMRALDIPARVVTGYQGGDFNPVDGFLTVRQSDAHAWAEVWLAERGWVRVDPTAAIAPERVNRTASAASQDQQINVFGVGVGDLSFLRTLRFNWEALENSWNQWVLSYSAERQRQLLRSLGLKADMYTLSAIFTGCTSVLLGLLALISLRHRVERKPLADVLALLHERLERAGIKAPTQLGPRDLQAHVSPQLGASSAEEVSQVLLLLEQLRYSKQSEQVQPHQIRALKRAVRRLKLQALKAT